VQSSLQLILGKSLGLCFDGGDDVIRQVRSWLCGFSMSSVGACY